MKLLITGATGFLGSSLTRAFVSCGHEVVLLKRSFSDCRRIEDLLPRMVSYDLDLETLEEVFDREQGISAVIHTATCYGRSGESCSEIFSTNTAFPLRLLELASFAGVTAFVNSGTGLPGFLNPYALSKRQFGEWGRLYADKKEIRFINFELEHFYGTGDDKSKFSTHVIRSCVNNLAELNLTPGEQLRDFIHIDDVVDAYLLVLERSIDSSRYYQNIGLGSGRPVKIRSFVETVQVLADSTTRLNFGAVPYRDNEVMESCADLTALKELGWSPKISLEEGIGRTVTEEKAKGAVE